MNFLVLVVDDEPDVEMLFRQQFRRDRERSTSRTSRPTLRPLSHKLPTSRCTIVSLDADVNPAVRIAIIITVAPVSVDPSRMSHGYGSYRRHLLGYV